MMSEEIRSAYIHIPFCINKCGYCDFISYTNQPELKKRYIPALCREIAITRESLDEARPLSTVYFGGGTPSTFSPIELREPLRRLLEVYGIDDDAEITLEINPGTVDLSSMFGYKDAGFNRVSIGIQSFSDRILRTLGRIHTSAEGEMAIMYAFEAGFSNISCDIMTGLPGQSLTDVMDTLEKLILLKVPHISLYALSIEEGTPFYKKYGESEDLLPDPNLEREMYHKCIDRLKMEGYVHYEISNCALPGFASRHNTVYWKALPYYGFGCGAHAFVAGRRSGNTSDLPLYIDRMLSGDADLSTIKTDEEYIDRNESMKEYMLLGFRMMDGISKQEFFHRFGEQVFDVYGDQIAELQNKGLISHENGRVFLSRVGLDYANEVFRMFVGN